MLQYSGRLKGPVYGNADAGYRNIRTVAADNGFADGHRMPLIRHRAHGALTGNIVLHCISAAGAKIVQPVIGQQFVLKINYRALMLDSGDH